MKIRNHRDFWAGLLFVGAGAVFVIGATAIDVGDGRQPGPGYFPLLLGILTLLLGCLVNFKAVTFETDDGAPIGSTHWPMMLGTLGAVLLAALLLPVLGIWPTTFLLVAVLGFAAGGLTVRRWLIGSIVGAMLCWLVFAQMLGLTLVFWPAPAG